MRSRTESTRGAVEHADLSQSRTIVDVGGSLGHLAIALLERHPHLTACVLDLPEVIEVAERHAAGLDSGVRSRLSFVGGDMFADGPVADTYMVKNVMHDWDDGRCVRLLANCRARLRRDGRILGVDNVLPPMGDTGASGTKFLDMLMMLSLPGKERTEAEWRALYADAGLRLTAIVPINPRSVECIIEGRANP
jgi:SAM-dependent methyltransferase